MLSTMIEIPPDRFSKFPYMATYRGTNFHIAVVEFAQPNIILKSTKTMMYG